MSRRKEDNKVEYFRNKRNGMLKGIKCDCCGNKFIAGNTNGLPNGVGFEMEDGTLINVCRLCLMNQTKLDAFLKEKGYGEDESTDNQSNK